MTPLSLVIRPVRSLGATLLAAFILLPCLVPGLTGAATVEKDIPYKVGANISPYEQERCKLDLYIPAHSGRAFPTLVWFHGGALTGGIKDDAFSVRIAERLAGLGIGMALPNYRLSPKATYPAYIEDAAAAFAYVRAHIAEKGGEPAQVFVGGHSAGGYLTFMLGLDQRYLQRHGLPTSSIAGLVPVSGQTMTHYTVREERGLPKDTVFADDAAPIHFARKDAPPMLILYADKDMTARVEENRYLAAVLKGTGHTAVQEMMIIGRDHGSVAGRIAEPGDPAAEAIVKFIRSTAEQQASAAAAQHGAIGVAKAANPSSSGRTTHPDAQWFANAGLGLFIHYGLSSVDGRVDLSWGMMADTPWDKGGFKLKPEDYFNLAVHFNPTDYHPEHWLKAAQEAGFRYAVMTTKHHEGFALWPSQYGDFNTKKYMAGRDLVKPYIDACRANNLKVGLYYSPPDWYYNRQHMSFRYRDSAATNYVPYGLRHEPIVLPEMTVAEKRDWDEKYRVYLRGQIEELLTQYGRIDLLWFDGGPDAISLKRIRELQPGIVINPRMHGQADFTTAEVAFPKTRPTPWWEMCAIWNSGGWGYTAREDYRSTASVLEEFACVRAWGGNYLINVGPRPDGELPDRAYARLHEFAVWMRVNGPAVLDTQAGAWPEACNVPVTRSTGKLYFLLPPDFKDKVLLKTSAGPTSLKFLRDSQPVLFAFDQSAGLLSFQVAGETKTVTVLVAEGL